MIRFAQIDLWERNGGRTHFEGRTSTYLANCSVENCVEARIDFRREEQDILHRLTMIRIEQKFAWQEVDVI